MWRIKKLTEVFSPAGFGWYTEIVRTWTEASESGEMAVFVDINLYVKKDGEWSRPIFGNGGNKLIANEKKYENGQTVYIPYLDDDAYKKTYTDAISVAAKALGVGADCDPPFRHRKKELPLLLQPRCSGQSSHRILTLQQL